MADNPAAFEAYRDAEAAQMRGLLAVEEGVDVPDKTTSKKALSDYTDEELEALSDEELEAL